VPFDGKCFLFWNLKKAPRDNCATFGEILGESILRNKGLKCGYIISRLPVGEPIAARAIPVLIFQTSTERIQTALRRWCKDPLLVTADFRDIVD
jgi:DNA polymerase epsilon subunit 1